jgi:hypothetical protein
LAGVGEVVVAGFKNRFVSWGPDASGIYDIDSTLLHSSPSALWWYAGGDQPVFYDTTVQFSNGQQIDISKEGAAKLYRPQLINFHDDPPAYPSLARIDGLFSLALGDGNSHGDMRFSLLVSSKYSGRADFTQLVKRDAVNGNGQSRSTGGNFWLDTSRFYLVRSSDPEAPRSVPAGGNLPLYFTDNPYFPVGHSLAYGNTTTIVDDFETYIMFRPDKGSPRDNIYVCLGRILWSWSASASWHLISLPDGGMWQIDSGGASRPTPPDDSDNIPTWLHTYEP